MTAFVDLLSHLVECPGEILESFRKAKGSLRCCAVLEFDECFLFSGPVLLFFLLEERGPAGISFV